MAELEPLPVGYRLDRYVIEAELGPTSAGRAYRAHDTALNQVVAINILAPALRDERGVAKLRASFQRAFRKKRDQVHDYGEFQGIPYVVVAYVPAVGAAIDVGQE